jgi:probable phosphoglycerate mutase
VPTTIVMVRHGETDWNREGRFQGHSDLPLNAAGRNQAYELAGLLSTEAIDVIYASPLRRAYETAEIVADRLGLEVRACDALREANLGSWEGLTLAEVEARYPEGYRRWVEYREGWHDGETYDELGQRVVAGILEIASRHAGDRVLAVTHGGPIRSTVATATGTSFATNPVRIGNCAVLRFAVRDRKLERVD